MNATGQSRVANKNWSAAVRRVLVFSMLLVVGVLMLIPFLFMISISFDMDARLSVPFPPHLIPVHFGWDSYRIAIQGIDMFRLYGNTIMVSAGVIAASIVSSLMAGYALSKIKLKGGRIILLLALATMMIPPESTIIPVFLLFKQLGLLNSYWAFYLQALSFPFGAFLMKQYIDGLPGELRESALIDGAGEFRVLLRIYLPLCAGMIATITVLQFLANWNNFLWPLILLTDPLKYTIQIGIANFNVASGNGDSMALPSVNMAATVMSLGPVLIVYLFFQRYIVESIANTGIKG